MSCWAQCSIRLSGGVLPPSVYLAPSFVLAYRHCPMMCVAIVAFLSCGLGTPLILAASCMARLRSGEAIWPIAARRSLRCLGSRYSRSRSGIQAPWSAAASAGCTSRRSRASWTMTPVIFFLITPFAVVSAAAGARLGEIAQGVHECGRLVGPSDDYGLAARSTPGVHPCLWPCWALSKDVLGECVECRW